VSFLSDLGGLSEHSERARGKACISRKDLSVSLAQAGAENAKKSGRQEKLTENEISLFLTLPRV